MKPKKLRFREVEDLMEYNEQNQGYIHLETFRVLKREWGKHKKCVDVDLFEVELTDDPEMEEVILNVLSEEWVTALEIGLEYFEETEEYEKCAPINKLLKTIKKSQI
jgi:hypothetical protein